jgi:hypothetical protein
MYKHEPHTLDPLTICGESVEVSTYTYYFGYIVVSSLFCL